MEFPHQTYGVFVCLHTKSNEWLAQSLMNGACAKGWRNITSQHIFMYSGMILQTDCGSERSGISFSPYDPNMFFFSKYYGCPYPFVARLRRFVIFGAPYEIDWKHSCDVRSGASWHANAWQWDKMNCQLTWMVLMSPGCPDLATYFCRIFSHGFIQQMSTLWLLYAKHSCWRSAFSIGKPSINGSFSLVIVNYQRANVLFCGSPRSCLWRHSLLQCRRFLLPGEGCRRATIW